MLESLREKFYHAFYATQVKAELHTNSERGGGQKKTKKKQVVSHGEDISDLIEGGGNGNAASNGNDDDDFSNLRKLISEGRIRDELYKNRSSRKIDTCRLFSRE